MLLDHLKPQQVNNSHLWLQDTKEQKNSSNKLEYKMMRSLWKEIRIPWPSKLPQSS
jgi:hypothetical protein